MNGELDYKESWVSKNWCFWTVVLEKTLESPLDFKEIQPVHHKGDQSWVFIGRTDVEAETPILWSPDAKSWLIGKDPDAGRDWGQEKGMAEEEMIGWHHQLNGHEFGWTLGVGDGQGGLECCGSWGCKELDTTERLNWTKECLLCKMVPVLQVYQGHYWLSPPPPPHPIGWAMQNWHKVTKTYSFSCVIWFHKKILEKTPFYLFLTIILAMICPLTISTKQNAFKYAWGIKQNTMWMKVLGRSVVSNSVTPWTVVCQALLFMEFCRQEY